MAGRPRELTFAQRLTYSLPQLGMNASGIVLGQWLVVFYRPSEGDIGAGRLALVGAGVLAAVMIFGRIVDAIADPLIGFWSDRCSSRMGRRIPFILFGTPLLAASYGALWFPPFEPGSAANGVYLAAVFSVYWVAFTAVVAPYVALLPEIATTTRARVGLSAFMGGFIVVGNISAAVAGGPVVDAWKGGGDFAGVHLDTGHQLLGLIGAATLLLFLVPLVNIRETPITPQKVVRIGLFEAIGHALRNRAFWPLLGIAVFLQSATVMLLTVMPFMAEQVLVRPPGEGGLFAAGEGGTAVAVLFGILFVGAVLWMPFINALVRRLTRKGLMLLTGKVFGLMMMALPLAALFPDPAVFAIGAMIVLAFPAGVALVLPPVLYSDVVDYDETITGSRREGIYTGSMALVTKTALGLAAALTVGLLEFGDSRADPTGILLVPPVAGLLVFLGVWLFGAFPQEEIEVAVAKLRAERDAAGEPS